MRFTLADLKKTISRRKERDGDHAVGPRIVPFLLRPGELVEPLAELIALFEAHIGRERVTFPVDRPAELIGDYRLARCLVICLSEWYEWHAPEWPEGATTAEEAALARLGIDSPSALRLALYDHVNATAGGYLAGDERVAELDAFAGSLGLARSTLDDLLQLDAEPQMVFERVAAAPPTPDELAARYNQRAVETLLANASVVEWTLDPRRDATAEPLGTLVKRACFLARKTGVQYEISFEAAATAQNGADAVLTSSTSTSSPRVSTLSALPSPRGRGAGGEVGRELGLVAEGRALYAVPSVPPLIATEADPALATLDSTGQPLLLTLYGPQELTGAPTQYGERLARLCRALLGYRRDPAAKRRAALSGDGLRGVARVYLHGRPLAFVLDDALLRVLSPAGEPSVDRELPAASDGAADLYDSSLERQLAEEWASLEREHATAGWRLEREPEPIVASGSILVPDFALRRGERRIFLEIAGYWRPEYRERKLRKLSALAGSPPLVLAAPEAARPDFAALAGRLPLLWYRTYLSAPALLALLEHDFNDFAARLALLDPEAIRAELDSRGRISEREGYDLLRCYTRAELAAALERLGEVRRDGSSGPASLPGWIEGVGLCAQSWREDLLATLRVFVASAPGGRMPLGALATALVAARPELADVSEAAVEALAHAAGLLVARSSLFAAHVSLADAGENAAAVVPPDETVGPPDGKPGGPKSQPRRTAKRKLTESSYSTSSLFGPEGH
jgi:predicted nuclease of restriction endonuclease-like RecB superfamily